MFKEGPPVAYIPVIPATKPQVPLADIAYRKARKEDAAPVWAPVAAEEAAEKELAEITPRNADLLRIADRHPAPQAWYDEEPPMPAAGRVV